MEPVPFLAITITEYGATGVKPVNVADVLVVKRGITGILFNVNV